MWKKFGTLIDFQSEGGSKSGIKKYILDIYRKSHLMIIRNKV